MATLGEYLGAGASTTKLLLHLNGNSTDSSGNGNNGTDTAITYSQANGKFGQGAGFNGTSSKIVTGNLGISGSQARTYIFWIKPSTVGVTAYLFDNGEATAAKRFLVYMHSSGKVGVNTWEAQDMSSNDVLLSTTEYKNIIITYSGGASLNSTSTKIYVNGNQVGTTNPSTNTLNTTNSPQYIGSSLGSTNFFPGIMDESFVEQKEWSASEVKKYYTYAKGRFGII